MLIFLLGFDPKSVYCILRSCNGSTFLFPTFPNFPNCCSPMEMASIYANYLKSHFSESQPKALQSAPIDSSYKFRQATCLEESRSSFLLSTHLHFLPAADLSFSTAYRHSLRAYPILNHLTSSSIDLLYIFNLSWSLQSFSFISKSASIIPMTRWENLSTLFPSSF